MSLTRQGLPTVRTEHKSANLSAKGAYVLADSEGKRQVILIATGSEVSIALKAREALQAQGIGTRVVSMPCMELFAEQDEAYRRKVLPAGTSCASASRQACVRVGIAGFWGTRTRSENRVHRNGPFWRICPSRGSV